MQSAPGIYALIMSLHESRRIRIGKFGKFDFDPGWYVYVGSAHGQGGLKRRTDHHLRCDKRRKHWHVDYIRPFATIGEIWFSLVPASWEHDWVWTMMRMHGATVPVARFGARDCKRGCEAHFFQLRNRPFPAEFRADLLRGWPDHPPIFTEFVEPATDDPVTLNEPAVPALVTYDRGRRVLELLRRAAYDGGPATDVDATRLSFAKGSPARDLAERMAPLMSSTTDSLIAAVHFAHAVDRLVSNCKENVFGVLFQPDRPQSQKAIMQLSRTADTRQRFRISGVLEGRFRSVAPQADDPVFDTVAFSEVPSRLRRARGAIETLEQEVSESADDHVRHECCRLVKLNLAAARQLRIFLKREHVSDQDVPRKLSKDVVWPVLASRDVRGTVVGKARQSLRLTIKNVWDYPEMQRRGIIASPAERTNTRNEIERIVATAKAVLATLDNE